MGNKNFHMLWLGTFLIGIVTSDINLVIYNWPLYRNENEYVEENKQVTKEYVHFMCFYVNFKETKLFGIPSHEIKLK